MLGSIDWGSGKYCLIPFLSWEVLLTTLGSIDFNTQYLRVPCLFVCVCVCVCVFFFLAKGLVTGLKGF